MCVCVLYRQEEDKLVSQTHDKVNGMRGGREGYM